MMIRKLLAVAGLCMITAPVHAQTQSGQNYGVSGLPELTLGAWSGLAEDDRQVLILAAIEGFFIATVNNPEVGNAVNEKCLASLTPGKIDRRLLKVAEKKPFTRFSDAFFNVATCEKKDKQR